MRILPDDVAACEQFCRSRSVIVRARRGDVGLLVQRGLSHLNAGRPCDGVAESMRETVGPRHGNPVLVYVLLYVVIPVLAKLVVEWWLKHRTPSEGEMDGSCGSVE
jgi:hypothetical protein